MIWKRVPGYACTMQMIVVCVYRWGVVYNSSHHIRSIYVCLYLKIEIWLVIALRVATHWYSDGTHSIQRDSVVQLKVNANECILMKVWCASNGWYELCKETGIAWRIQSWQGTAGWPPAQNLFLNACLIDPCAIVSPSDLKYHDMVWSILLYAYYVWDYAISNKWTEFNTLTVWLNEKMFKTCKSNPGVLERSMGRSLLLIWQ